MVKLHQAYVFASESLARSKAFSDQKCTKCRLAAGLRPDPLGELTGYSAPQTSSCIAFSYQKCTKCRLAAGLHPDPLGCLQRSPDPLAAMHFQTKNASNVVWLPGSARTRWGNLQRSTRPPSCTQGLARKSIFRPIMHQMSFGGRGPPGPDWEAYSAPQDSLAALKLLAPSALDARRLASSLRRSATERACSPFFHSNTGCFRWPK